MAKILHLKTQQQAHEELTMKHREDFINRMESHYKTSDIVKEQEEFDAKTWKWSTVIFYITLLGIVAGIFVYKEAKACGEEVKPMEPIKVVRGI